jgi:uroporphyrinogen decarboxylase
MEKLTHKERMRRALCYEPVDCIPTQVNYTAAVGEKMAAHFNVAVAELPALLDNHMIRVDLTYPSRMSDDGKVKYDWWGVGYDTEEEGYFTVVHPLADAGKDFDAYAWPDPAAPGLMDDAARAIEQYGDEYFITPNFGFALFERAWSLCGFNNFFLDMAMDPVWAGELFDRIADIQVALIERFIDLGVDGGYFGDDYGSQGSTLFSPKMFRDLIKPRLARMFEPFRKRGMPILMHSDGHINEIIPDLVEIGLTTLNPVQPEVLDHAWLHQEFDGNLAFYGGISTQTVLPHGTPDEVRYATQLAVEKLAPNGTGLLLAPSHRMMLDIPVENIAAMLEAFAAIREAA